MATGLLLIDFLFRLSPVDASIAPGSKISGTSISRLMWRSGAV